MVAFILTYLIIQVAARGPGLLKPPVVKLALWLAAFEILNWFIESQTEIVIFRDPTLFESYIFLVIYVTVLFRIAMFVVDVPYDAITEKS